MSGLRGKNKIDKRERILKAALKLFPKQGFGNTKVSHLAEEAGIGKGTIYSYFKRKEDIFFYFLQREVEKLLTKLTSIINSSGDTREKVLALLLGQIKFHRTNKEFSQVLIKMYLSEIDKLSPEFINWHKEYLNFLVKILDDGKKNGNIRKDANSQISAGIIFSIYLVSLVLWHSEFLKSSKDIKRFLTLSIDQLCRGFGSKT